MGAFTISRNDTPEAATEQAVRLAKSFERQGFGVPRTIKTPYWNLCLYAKYSGKIPISLIERDGDFAAYSGTLIYRGTTGIEALNKILDDFGGNSVEWEKMFGSYCLIIFRNGQLSFFPDRLGLYKVYKNSSGTVISSSFLAVLETIARPTINTQSLYEYVFQGATYDDRTLIDQVELVERHTTFYLDREIHAQVLRDDLWDGTQWSNFDEHVALTLEILRRNVGAIVQAFGNNIDTALSGGYDSRLLLALLREQGAQPRVHVYGNEHDADVIIAKAIAASEGFPISHTDKSRHARLTLEEFPVVVAKNFAFLDGYPGDGIFDNGSDVETRLQRAREGAIALNGGGGEIFRNFFYLADRSYSVQQILWAFFSQFDSSTCTETFSESEYLENLSKAIVRLLNLPLTTPAKKTKLSRAGVEYLYPCFRCVYWMGRNNSINNRFGYATTPFVESNLIRLALQIPLRFKNHGRFEAALIRGADFRLAQYASSYGHNYVDEPPPKRIFSDYTTLLRPTYARKLSYRLHGKVGKREIDAMLTGDSLKKVIDVSFPEMRRYFKIGKISQISEFRRICTLEYLCEQYQLGHAC